MSIKQIENISFEEKESILKSIFQNYQGIKHNNMPNQKNLNQKDYNKLQLFVLTESIITLMDPEESKVITSVFLHNQKIEDKYKFQNAINKFVFYLLA